MRTVVFHLCCILSVYCLAPQVLAQDLEQLVQDNEPAVVVIHGVRQDTGDDVQSSGCCVHADGYILTTAHQIAGVDHLEATFADGAKTGLSVVELSTDHEIALLKTEKPVQVWARLGNAETLRSGSPLISIATPMNMAFSTIRGIVSSTNRTYNGYPVLQADLPASPGSSGGPVFDRYGNFVGMIIGKLESEQYVTVVNLVNNAYVILQKHGIMKAPPSDPQALLAATKNASAIERDAIEAYNAGVTAPDPGAKVKAYAKAVELMPDFYQAWFNQGIAYVQIQQLEAAEQAYRKAGTLKPEAIEVKRNLGRLLLRAKRVQEAVPLFEEAARLAPDLPQSHNDLGEAYRQSDRGAEALAEFEKALELDANYAKARYNLALTLAGSGKVQEAIAELERYLKLEPRPPDSQEVKKFIEQLSAKKQ